MRQFGLIAVLVVTVVANLPAAESVRPAISGTVSEFSLKDFRGKPYALSDFKSSKLVVIAVLGTECPLAKQSAVKLQRFADEYAERGVAVLALDANRQDSLAEIAAFAKSNSLTYPILKDVNQQVIESLQATRTPEVFVLDADRFVRYHGRVDDQFAVGGKFRKSPTRDDLKLAVEELLEGRSVSVPETPAIGCLIGRAREPKNDSKVTYSNQISRILQKNCVECHRPGEIAPFSLTEYQEVAGWADMIVEVTRTNQMPPWHASPEYGHFANDRRMSEEDLSLLQQWAEAGMPEGNRADLPPARTFTEGWQLPRQPDHVVWMSEKPFKIPTEGTVKYQYFSVDAGLLEDKWLTAAEIIPGNRSVVHHVIVFMTGEGKLFNEEQQMVVAYVPGMRIAPFPKGMAKRLPKGTQFVFQMHYTPNGIAGEDRTRIGLVFADPTEITHEVKTAVAINRKFEIEPEKDNQAFDTRPFNFPIGFQLLSLSPHMHLRGKSFRYELTMPNGSKETLLDVPHYDFNWQTAYCLKEPRPIPQGSKLTAYASFDNSSNNLANPDPSKTVTWGEQSWDEMLLGYFDVAVPRGPDEPTKPNPAADPESKAMVKRIFDGLDKNKDGKISRKEVIPSQKEIFDKLDTDKSDTVSREEVEAGLSEILKMSRP